MHRAIILGVSLMLPGIALACGGKPSAASDQTTAATEVAAAKDPASCAKKADLVGSNCSYTTGMMAQRVLAEGAPYSYAGTLVAAENGLQSHVAAPYTVGPDQINVVANEVVEALYAAGLQAGRVSLEGKLLEVDGLKYFVLTSYAALTS